jgi:hypothetical protein
MTDIQLFILSMTIFVIINMAYYAGWDKGFKLGKQRGWSNGYNSGKAINTIDEVFDYEKN